MAKRPEELFREGTAEFYETYPDSNLGLLTVAIFQFGLPDRADELKKEMRMYKEFANRQDMSLMELSVLDQAVKLLDAEDRVNFLRNPESYIPNFSVFSELGRVIEDYTPAELIKLNNSTEISTQEAQEILPKDDTMEHSSKLDLAVVSQLGPRAEKLKSCLPGILNRAVQVTTTAISSADFTFVDSNPHFMISIVNAAEEAILKPGMSTVFIGKLTEPGSDRKLTRQYLIKRTNFWKSAWAGAK